MHRRFFKLLREDKAKFLRQSTYCKECIGRKRIACLAHALEEVAEGSCDIRLAIDAPHTAFESVVER